MSDSSIDEELFGQDFKETTGKSPVSLEIAPSYTNTDEFSNIIKDNKV